MYLNQEVKSHTKKTIIANKGDKVTIVTRTLNMVLVVDNKGFRFWVKSDKLSIKPL
jgi:hypothetical protein